jgi:hypothetical protein
LSIGSNRPLREGAWLIPWALPFVPLGVALRVLRKAWDACKELSRARGFVLALSAGALGFAGAEIAFGAGLARVLPHF